MKIVQIGSSKGGYRSPIQSWDEPCPPDGCALVPDTLDTTVFYAHNGFVTLTVEADTVTAMEPNAESWKAWKESIPKESNIYLREQAYNTESIISWQDKMITVTSASELWTYYTSEGDTETANALTEKIASAKKEIRNKYLDTNNSAF